MQVILKMDGRTSSFGAPLVMHNERLADPLDPFTREIAKVSKKRGKTEADFLEIGRLEFYGGLYTDPVISGPEALDGQAVCLPAWNIIRCLQDGGKRHKRGADVLRGIVPLAESAKLVYDGPEKPEKLWKAGAFALRKTVGIQRSRTMRTRPHFTDWQAELPVEVDEVVFDLDSLRNIWKDAGKYAGLGEMRPIFGRFTATVEEVS